MKSRPNTKANSGAMPKRRNAVNRPPTVSMSAVDLFCGVGGLTRGLILEGIRVTAGVDTDPACKYPYEYNNGARFIQKDVNTLHGIDLAPYFADNDIKILVGCAPCQPFSTYTQGRDNHKSDKWDLLYAFARIIRELKPHIVSMENVPRLTKHAVYSYFIGTLEDGGYHVSEHEIYCPDYGIPQTRTRLVVLASVLGPLEIIKPTHAPTRYATVRQAIGRLEPLSAGGVSTKDRLHCASTLSELNMKRIRSSRPGGTWRDWSKSLRADCHDKLSGETYAAVYGRMKWDEPAPTITTQCYGFGNGRFGHPDQDRAITLREAALLQTFPRNYRFVDPKAPVTFKGVGRLIGNAVPVRLGRVIAISIRKHLETRNANA